MLKHQQRIKSYLLNFYSIIDAGFSKTELKIINGTHAFKTRHLLSLSLYNIMRVGEFSFLGRFCPKLLSQQKKSF
jgi:hypothetical protein